MVHSTSPLCRATGRLPREWMTLRPTGIAPGACSSFSLPSQVNGKSGVSSGFSRRADLGSAKPSVARKQWNGVGAENLVHACNQPICRGGFDGLIRPKT